MTSTFDSQTIVLTTFQEIKLQLEQRKEEIYDEIKEYPFPIPACDAQFNYLLELRNGVAQELNQVSALLAECDLSADSIQLVTSFIQSSMVLKHNVKTKLQQALHELHA